jgi:hypothetical protein
MNGKFPDARCMFPKIIKLYIRAPFIMESDPGNDED